MKITILQNIGFCFGVERSIKLSYQALKDDNPKPLYLLGLLVHNEHVNNELIKNGFKLVDNYKLLLKGNTKTFISTAHGIKESTKQEILSNNHKLIETTCAFVSINNNKIMKYFIDGYDIIYIGKKNHQESNVIKDYVHLIENIDDLKELNINNNKIVLTNQTTISFIDIENITNYCKTIYPFIKIDTFICPATKERQDEVYNVVKNNHSVNDLWLVVGDAISNNTNKLKSIINKFTNNCYLINSKEELKNITFYDSTNVFITSGTSCPKYIIDEIYQTLKTKPITK